MTTLMRYSSNILALALVTCAATASAGSLSVPGQGAQQKQGVAIAAKASPTERKQLARQFVAKWGGYVQRVFGVPAKTWSTRMASNFAVADSTNFRNALKRDTFEGAMAELTGTGHRLSDDAIITKFASMDAAASGSGGTGMSLGALTNDLVYTPVQPCRIVDTRTTAAGAIAANGTRNFVAFGISNFSSQGGSATNCGVNPLSATAVAINLTAVTPASPGYATAYPYNTTQPLAASVNYAAGAIVNNALIVQTPNPVASFDFTLYTAAQSHFVADIVGYFAPPVATALQCVETSSTTSPGVIPDGTVNALAPSCAAGYTQTATNCVSSSWLMPIVFIKDGTCSARNNDSSNQTLSASRTCCRVPGR